MPVRAPHRQKMSRKVSFFEEEYGKLNGHQKKAVDAIEGPVMVIAGPGSGKTQVLAMRVGRILQKTHMNLGNILCLTFSVSGAQAMRERLQTLIGVEAFRVTVSTTHGFCNDIIGRFPQVFEDWQAFEQISDSERIREMNKIIDQNICCSKLLNKKYPYLKTSEILSRIAQMKREGKGDARECETIADQYQAILQEKSKGGSKAHERDLLQGEKFKDFLQLFFAYQEMLVRTRRYDYEDMLLYVLRILQEEDWLLASLQERYQYILVDEFQDLNGVQYALIERLTTYPTIDHSPNLFVVGDDDQAIYRFQGANIQNMLKFYERFPHASIIPLTTSYRCSQPILDAANALISHNTERLVGKIPGLKKALQSVAISFPRRGRVQPSPRLRPAGRERGLEPAMMSPSLIFAPTETSEPFLVTDLVQEKMDEGISPPDIAILTQTNRELLPLYDALRARKIPVYMHGKLDLLAHPLVTQVIAILRAIHNPGESSALATALGCACFGIHPADLGQVYAARRDHKCSLLDILLCLDQPGEGMVSVYYHDITSMIRARDFILDLHQKIGSRTTVETMEHLLKESGLIGSVTNLQNGAVLDPLEYIPLHEFFTRIKYRAYEQPGFSFDIFLNDIDLASDPTYPECRMTYELPGLREQGVQLMTAHQSKGREFDTVILPNFKEGHWDRRRKPPSISIPEDLLFGWGAEQKSFEQSQDERRVAYVAITRAKHQVIFTCAKELSKGNRVQPVTPSAFVAQCQNVIEESREDIHISVFPEVVRDLGSDYKAFLRARVAHLSLSPTALNHFLEDPMLFLECDLLQVPQSKNASLVYGNAVHWALREWGISLQNGCPMDERGFMQAFRTYLETREVLTKKECQRLFSLGEESLPRYYRERLSQSLPCVHNVESPMSARLGDVPLRGKIDRIDLEHPQSAHAVIIDFKTGRVKTESQIRDSDYYRQLTFYALLFEHSRSILKPGRFILDFIGEGEERPALREFTISPADKRELEQVIRAVWKKINDLDFSLI